MIHLLHSLVLSVSHLSPYFPSFFAQSRRGMTNGHAPLSEPRRLLKALSHGASSPPLRPSRRKARPFHFFSLFSSCLFSPFSLTLLLLLPPPSLLSPSLALPSPAISKCAPSLIFVVNFLLLPPFPRRFVRPLGRRAAAAAAAAAAAGPLLV